jgi:Zn-dependent metalloprotease
VSAFCCSRITRWDFQGATLAIILLLPAAGGHAAVSSREIREEARIAVEQFRWEQPQATITLDPVTGLARSLVNVRASRSLPAGSADAAADFVAEHRKLLLGDRSPAELELREVQQLATSSHVRYQQLHRGLPVWGARLSVHTDAEGHRMVHSSVRPRLQLDTTPVLKPADAVRAAADVIGAGVQPALPDGAKATLGVLPLPDGARLVYRVDVVDVRIFVDARSGAILKKLDRRKSTQDEGIVVDENLLTTTQLVTRPFPNLSHSNGYLHGAFVNLWTFDRVEWSNYFVWGKRLSKATDYHFTARPNDGRFDEQMAYYHVNRGHDYFRRTFGFTGRDDRMHVFVHVPEIDWKEKKVLGAMDNAYFSPYFDSIFFGDGTGTTRGGLNPTSRDADVIYHEYTHAVMDRIVPDLSWERDDFGGALQEAYSDYFACTINNDPDMGEYSVADTRGMRNLRNRHRYPDDVNDPYFDAPEEHWTGLIWGGACWDLRLKLGPAVADQLVFHSMYYLPEDGSATFSSAAQGVLAADQEKYAGAHKVVIREVMRLRGISVLES